MTLAIDLIGTFAFAMSGALLAVRKGYDVLGLAVLALAAGLGGGIIRDVIIGVEPPRALDEQWLLLAVAVAVVAAFAFPRRAAEAGNALAIFDAAGLAAFSVAGALVALRHGVPPVPAVLLGVMTAIGGGLARDLLALEQPLVLREEVYGLAALVGAALLVLGIEAGVSQGVTAPVAGTAAFGLRVVAWRRGWQAPRPPGSPR